jgi:hypothetical protein
VDDVVTMAVHFSSRKLHQRCRHRETSLPIVTHDRRIVLPLAIFIVS